MTLRLISCHKYIHIPVNQSLNKIVLLNKRTGHQPHIMEQQVNSIVTSVYTVLCVTG
jgi:hypothetical protein